MFYSREMHSLRTLKHIISAGMCRLCPASAWKWINTRCSKQSLCSLSLLCGLDKYCLTANIAYSTCCRNMCDFISTLQCCFTLTWNICISYSLVKNKRALHLFHARNSSTCVQTNNLTCIFVLRRCCRDFTSDVVICWHTQLVLNQQLRPN